MKDWKEIEESRSEKKGEGKKDAAEEGKAANREEGPGKEKSGKETKEKGGKKMREKTVRKKENAGKKEEKAGKRAKGKHREETGKTVRLSEEGEANGWNVFLPAEGEALTYSQIRRHPEVNILIGRGNEVLGALGYTEHSVAHAAKVAETAGRILEKLGYSSRDAELGRIAGYMHDIGNSVNRCDHAHTGAILAWQILKEAGMDLREAAVITSAIGNHDEETGTAVDAVSAALILADKTDVRRNRVRNRIKASFDAHDRVNYAALSSRLVIQKEKKMIRMELELDDSMCSVMDYFEIFLKRMIMCRRAAEALGCRFRLVANGNKVC